MSISWKTSGGNREKKEVDSFGEEITGEALVCVRDAREHYGIEEPAPASIEIVGGKVFEEKLAEPIKSRVINSIVHNALARTEHDTKRAKADCTVVIPGIKAFIDRNKGFVF